MPGENAGLRQSTRVKDEQHPRDPNLFQGPTTALLARWDLRNSRVGKNFFFSRSLSRERELEFRCLALVLK